MPAIPEAAAAVDAFLALEAGQAVGAFSNCLARAHGYACLLVALCAVLQVAEAHVIGETRIRLDLAADEQRVLL